MTFQKDMGDIKVAIDDVVEKAKNPSDQKFGDQIWLDNALAVFDVGF